MATIYCRCCLKALGPEAAKKEKKKERKKKRKKRKEKKYRGPLTAQVDASASVTPPQVRE